MQKFVCFIFLCSQLISPEVMAVNSRIKDIAYFQGVRENILVGYGLVVGLNGTGDDVQANPFTRVSLSSMLERLGVQVPQAAIKTKSVAAVMVTASLPPFSRNGMKIDVSVSTLGNTKSLMGGTLLVTPLLAADGAVYAVAQGALAVGGFSAGGKAENVTKGVPTSARIINGAIIEREIDFDFNGLKEIKIALSNPDFTTAKRMVEAINRKMGLPLAFAMDSTTVRVQVPSTYHGKMVDFMTILEQISVEPDASAIVVIDEQSGIIVMSDNVRISQVAVAQGNLIVEVQENDQVSQPNEFANVGQTEVVDRTNIRIDENSDARMRLLDPGADLRSLVEGLNNLGVGPRDLITILQTIKTANALQADVKII